MKEILSVEAMRESDARTIAAGTSCRELMMRAGRGILEAAEWQGPAAIVCGSGNNAGDGYVLAELLCRRGVPCRVILLSDRFSPDGSYYFERCRAEGAEIRAWSGPGDLNGAAVVVDCIFGTGFRGSVRGKAREAIEAINACGARVISADINSGLNGDSGLGECWVRSDLTVSIGFFQPGHFLNQAKDIMKARVNCDIGITPAERPYRLAEESDLAGLFPPRPHFSHKGDWGYAALIGGSLRYSGAVRLASMANAAMRSGAGVVRTAFPASLYPVIAPALLESTAFPLPDRDGQILFDPAALKELTGNTRAAAFGMGAGITEDTGKCVAWLLEHGPGRLILDADGLTLLSRMDRNVLKTAPGDVILTPHLKEFSRLTGKSVSEIQEAPIPLAQEYAKETGTVVLLKGPCTVVTDGEEVLLVDAGCPGMATAGSGDVLSGVLTALAAWMNSPLQAAAAAAYVNGKAGELAEKNLNSVSMTAGDTVSRIPEVVSKLMRLNAEGRAG